MQRTARLTLWALASALLIAVVPIVAQEAADQEKAAGPAPAAAADAPKAADGKTGDSLAEPATDTMLGLIVESGWVGWIFFGVLGLFSIVAVMVALERAVNLTRGKVMPQAFRISLKQLVEREEDHPNEFRVLCENDESPMSNILQAGLLRVGRPLPEVEKSMEDAAAREMAALRARNRPLSVVASVAPLVGLLGTVVGMIFAFRTAAQAGLGKAEVLAQGIYLALLTTAAGLTIAIPCLLLAALFNTRVDRYMRDIDENLMDTMPCFARMEQQPGSTREESYAEVQS